MESSSSTCNPLVILNPAANRGNMDRYRAVVRSCAEREKAEYVETTKQGEAQERAEKAAREGRPLIIVGGDGSVHEVVNGILAAGRRVPLGIIPAGSGNDFAWNTLKLPRNRDAAIERAFNGELIDVDAGMVNGRYFANSFSVGLDADIAVAANQMRKLPFMSGSRLYYTATLKQLLFGYRHCPWLSIRLDAEERIGKTQARHYVLMAITNGPTYGAGFRINPIADHRDGLFDVCTIDYMPLLRALQLLPVVKKGEHMSRPEIAFSRARAVHIDSQNTVNVQMDGETTSAKSYSVEILPGALWVRV